MDTEPDCPAAATRLGSPRCQESIVAEFRPFENSFRKTSRGQVFKFQLGATGRPRRHAIVNRDSGPTVKYPLGDISQNCTTKYTKHPARLRYAQPQPIWARLTNYSRRGVN